MNLKENAAITQSDQNTANEETDAKYMESGAQFNENCLLKHGVMLDEEETVDLMSNWIMRAIMSMVSKKKKAIRAKNISVILGVTREEAQDALEGLARMGLMIESEAGFTGVMSDFRFDEQFINSGNQVIIHKKIRKVIEDKMRTNDVFGSTFSLSNIKIIQKNIPKIIEIMTGLENGESDENALDLYAFDFSFVKLSKGKSALNEII